MLDNIDPVVWLAGAALVGLLAYARYRAGSHYFNDRARFWSPVRSVVIPVLDHALRDVDSLYATNRASRDEYVATIQKPPSDVLDLLAQEGYQPQPLAGYKTDWKGREECASWASYHGRLPFPGAPEWLRPRQVHVTLFPAPKIDELPSTASRTVVTAHEEANPWRPDQWREHYRGQGVRVDVGRQTAALALNIDLQPAPAESSDEPSPSASPPVHEPGD